MDRGRGGGRSALSGVPVPWLSLLLVVRDEEELLPGCLAAAAALADEIVVVDTGSRDGTVAVAESFGATVLHRPWRDSFAEARNAALDAAHGDWILFLDADEHLQPGAAAAVSALLRDPTADAVAVAMRSLTGSGEAGTTHPALRIWRHRRDRRYVGRVHERLDGVDPTDVRFADVPVLHFGYLDRRWRAREKTRRNVELLLREPPTAFTAFNLGCEHARAGDWPAAADWLELAWAAVADGAWAELGFGPLLAARTARALRGCGRVADAERLLAHAISHVPEYTDLTFELAHCALDRGAPGDARRLLKRCLAQGDAPPPFVATVGAGSHLARALLDHITLPG